MKIKKATLEKLKSMGIKVSPFPTKEAYDKCFEAKVKEYMDWYEYLEEVAKFFAEKRNIWGVESSFFPAKY